jgi:hypothetical protein
MARISIAFTYRVFRPRGTSATRPPVPIKPYPRRKRRENLARLGTSKRNHRGMPVEILAPFF